MPRQMLFVWSNRAANQPARRLKFYLIFLQEKETGGRQPLPLPLPQMKQGRELGLHHQERQEEETGPLARSSSPMSCVQP
jgi:hypothetical protein